jgi:uncharacterized repeat protein (TIGR01451 family)
MSAARKLLLGSLAALALAAPASAGAATLAPAFAIQSLAVPTNFAPGAKAAYQVFVTNSGGAETDRNEIVIVDTLPAGLEVEEVALFGPRTATSISEGCEVDPGAVSTVTCKVSEALLPEFQPAKLLPTNGLYLEILVAVPADAAGTLVNRVEVEGGDAAAASAEAENEVSSEDAKAGLAEFKAELTGPDGLPVNAAASHPYQYTTSFAVNTVPPPPGTKYPLPAEGDLKNIEVALPPGLAANPTAIARCGAQDFNTVKSVNTPLGGDSRPNQCPAGSAVGVALVEQLEGQGGLRKFPIYNLIPPKGMPAQLGFQILGAPVYINAKIRSEGDYAAVAVLDQITEAQRVTAARFTIWGTPWDKSHETVRGRCAETVELCPVVGTPRPFLRLPSNCANPLLSTMSYTTWARPVTGATAGFSEAAPVGCSEPDFAPTIVARPTTNVADSPAGLRFNLHLPQKEHEDPNGLGEADLRDTAVKLPAGLVVNPASADGQAACTPAQVGLSTAPGQSPIHFDREPARCPNASKLGTVSATVPALDHPLEGSIYLAQQEQNPFKSLIAFYIVLEDPQTGIVVKQAAKVTPDPVTGRLTTTVAEVPQVPLEDFDFSFFEGARAPLRTPPRCGTHTTETEMTPWTAPEGQSAFPSDSFQVSAGPQGPCPTGALAPRLGAGLANPTAATYSPFSLRVTRPDASDELAAIGATLPTPFTANLSGIPYCSEAQIAQAAARTAPGQGALEAASPSCPAASAIGSTTAGAGAGPLPLYTGGKVYLAGPYKGAPLSMVAIVPALAGPFDLGVIVNRIAAYVDPESALIRAQSDPLPRILFGIPLDVRDIRANLDRPNFTLAGTNCDPKSVSATVQGTSGATALLSDRFQLGGCGALRFHPGLSLKLSGPTKRGGHPALKAVVSYPQGSNYANTAKASVALPHSEFLEQSHIRTICTRVQFAANACPKGSIYGKARVITPVLDKPLEGPIYLRSSSNPLPDMVFAVHGQLDVAAVGRIDSHNGGIRVSFESVPDVPLAKVVVEMQGGKKGLLVNSRNICNHTNRATARFSAHSGKTHDFRPVLRDSCKGGKSGKGGGGR